MPSTDMFLAKAYWLAASIANNAQIGGQERLEFQGASRSNGTGLRYNLGSRGVAQSGSASALGAEGRGFESLRPDQGINDLTLSSAHQ